MRGQYDQHGEKVTADVPAALPPLAKDAPHNRLGLAKWIVDPGNPLMARVTVNRIWQTFFGAGFVKSSGDFGRRGMCLRIRNCWIGLPCSSRRDQATAAWT